MKVAAAVRLAGEVASGLGLSFDRAVVLADRSNAVVHLEPAGVVARVCTRTANLREGPAWLRREVAVATHLAKAGAPVVPPSARLPPGPHCHDGGVMSFWEYVEELGDPVDPAAAAHALHVCHDVLADFEGRLPELAAPRESARVVDRLVEYAVLDAADSLWLGRRIAEVNARLERLGTPLRSLHGDSHLGNALQTARGPLWTDWEDAFLGPRAWDLACLVARARVLGDASERAEAALAAYGATPDDAELDLCIEARTLQAVAWSALLAHDRNARDPDRERRLRWLGSRPMLDDG